MNKTVNFIYAMIIYSCYGRYCFIALLPDIIFSIFNLRMTILKITGIYIAAMCVTVMVVLPLQGKLK